MFASSSANSNIASSITKCNIVNWKTQCVYQCDICDEFTDCSSSGKSFLWYHYFGRQITDKKKKEQQLNMYNSRTAKDEQFVIIHSTQGVLGMIYIYTHIYLWFICNGSFQNAN